MLTVSMSIMQLKRANTANHFEKVLKYRHIIFILDVGHLPEIGHAFESTITCSDKLTLNTYIILTIT